MDVATAASGWPDAWARTDQDSARRVIDTAMRAAAVAEAAAGRGLRTVVESVESAGRKMGSGATEPVPARNRRSEPASQIADDAGIKVSVSVWRRKNRLTAPRAAERFRLGDRPGQGDQVSISIAGLCARLGAPAKLSTPLLEWRMLQLFESSRWSLSAISVVPLSRCGG
jgi:hypothetical protein